MPPLFTPNWIMYNCYGFHFNLYLAVSTEALQGQGKPTSPRRDIKKGASPVSKEANGLDGGQESLEAKSLAGDKMNGDALF